MSRISELFETLRLSQEEAKAFRKRMFSVVSAEHWNKSFLEGSQAVGKMAMENMVVFQQVHGLLAEELTEEMATDFFEGCCSLYEAYTEDYRFLQPILDKLIPYYEEKKDYDKLITLYVIRYYVINDVKNRQFSIQKQDYSDLENSISLIAHYGEMSSSRSRRYLWKSYYGKIIIGLDTLSITPREAFACYDQMLKDWNREEVQQLDGTDEKCLFYLNAVKRNLTDAIYGMDTESEEIQKRFCQIAKDNYFHEYKLSRNEYELDVTVYAAYLYVLYLRDEQNKEEIFDELLEYFKYGFCKYQKQMELTEEALTFLINSTRIMFLWSRKGISEERKNKMFESFFALSEANWRKVDSKWIPIWNDLSRQLFEYLTYSQKYEMDARERASRLICQQSFFTYVNAKQLIGLCRYLFEKAYAWKPSLFQGMQGMQYEEMKGFVEECAKFHDIGILDMIPFVYSNLYEMNEEEEAQYRRHPEIGASLVNHVPSMAKYRDAIIGHHKYYDGKGGFPVQYDNTKSEYRIVVDILFLADQIDTMIDPVVSRGHNLTFPEILKHLEQEKGTKFNPDLVEMILSQEEVQKEILAFVTTKKTEIMFEYYHDLENMMEGQDIEEFILQIEEMVKQANISKNTDSLKPYLKKMFDFAEKEQSDDLLGRAYYYSMICYNIENDYSNAISYGLEAIRYFEKKEDYNRLAAIHNSIALNIECQSNPEYGIGHLMQAIEYSKLTDYPSRKGMYYNNLGDIFRQLDLFERALYYYHMGEDCVQGNEIYSLVLFYNIIYCYIRMDDKQKVQEYRDKIDQNTIKMETKDEKLDFPHKVYEAIIAQSMGDEEKRDQWLELIAGDLDFFQNFRLYTSEINLYLDLLWELNRTDEMLQQLDQYIAYARKQKVNPYIMNTFLQKRIMWAYLSKDTEYTTIVNAYWENLMEEQRINRADTIEQIEKSIMTDIQRERTKKEAIEDNEKLEKKVWEAQNASEAKSTFLSSMSHEIRTPIHAVIGLDEMILRESTEEHILQYAKDIQHAGQNLLNIVNDVLDFSKMEARKITIIQEEYDFVAFMKDMQKQFVSKAREKGLAFFIQCDPRIPRRMIADYPRIKQILQNLLSNAIKFTEQGSVVMQVALEKEEHQTASIRYTVKDTGIGVKKDELDKLLRPFERADEERNSSIEGTGLGLSIVNMLTEKMGGSFTIESEYGKGSEFGVTLRQKIVGAELIGEIDFAEVEEDEEKPLVAPAARILIVDDNAVNLKVITSLLKRTQVQVTTVRSGQACLELCEKEDFHMILLDHMMPEMDGLETLRCLRQKERYQNIPVIAMTANSGTGALEYYMQNGFQDFLSKPVDYHVMESKIRQYLPKEIRKNA